MPDRLYHGRIPHKKQLTEYRPPCPEPCSEFIIRVCEANFKNKKTLTNSFFKMKTNSWRVALLVLGLTLPGIVSADNIDYAVTMGNQLGTIDLQTGAFTQIGTVNGIAGGGDTEDLARLPGGLLYGSNTNSELFLIDPVALTTSLVGACGNNIFGLAFRQDGTLFGCSDDTLYQINPNTGAPTLVGAMGVNSIYYDIKFDSGGHLYLVENSTLYLVNTSTGQALQIGQSGAIGFVVWALDFDNGTLFGFTPGGQIVSINTTTGVGTFVANETESSPIVTAAPGGVSVGEPYLTIQLTNINSVALAWIAPSNAFSLQQNPHLTTTNWTSVTNSVSVTNSQNQVIVIPAVGKNFYRLVNP
jgi:hypothetical protein